MAGSASLLRDALTVLRRKLRAEGADLDETDLRSICAMPGKPRKYLEQAFDRIEPIDTTGLAPGLEVLVVPHVCATAQARTA